LNENQPAQQSDLNYSRNQHTSQQQILHSEALKPTIFEDSEGLPSPPPPQLVPYREHSSSSESSEVCGEESSRQLSWQEVQQLVSPSPLTVRSGIRTHTLYTGSAHSKAYCEGSDDCSVPSRTSSEASKSFTTIGCLVILAIFLFFVIQNIVSYNRGDATYEEL
uniref:Teneurin-2 n=1 Tax=Anisakis simplex TaxID=6269 RepID=A0A0M3J837_ANISI